MWNKKKPLYSFAEIVTMKAIPCPIRVKSHFKNKFKDNLINFSVLLIAVVIIKMLVIFYLNSVRLYLI